MRDNLIKYQARCEVREAELPYSDEIKRRLVAELFGGVPLRDLLAALNFSEEKRIDCFGEAVTTYSINVKIREDEQH